MKLTMKQKAILSLGAIVLAISLASAYFLKPKPAYCAWCPTWSCFDSSGCNGCKCFKTGNQSTGQCISLD